MKIHRVRSGLSLPALVSNSARLVVISPHLDDAVLSCGDLLARHRAAVVVTVFAGQPSNHPPLTSWDARAGFEPGADVTAARRREDQEALRVLGARPRWLDFPDPQYGSRPSRSDLADALASVLDELAPEVVVIPLGTFHDDHILASDAAHDVLVQRPTLTRLIYAEAIYRCLPGLVNDRLRALSRMGGRLRVVTAPNRTASNQKRSAVACYRSQVRALEHSWDGGVSDAFEAERYWQIIVPAAASVSSVRGSGEGRHGDRT
jgi:LmbE family N-acetylglucosaminyl deacetylase